MTKSTLTKPNGFQFKQFFVAHDRCAMKVNTDGILLGAVADISSASRILDLGTGTGLLALMLAQRSAAISKITAVELDNNAYSQALENVQQSPWRDKVQVFQGDVMALEFKERFDLIVSNPPYFSDSLATRDKARDLARTTVQSHFDWLMQANNWLSETGKISFILPFEAGEKLIAQSENSALCCVEKWSIQTKPNQAPKRMIVSFSKQVQPCCEQALMIYDETNQYSDAFKQLTNSFYLNM